MSEKACEYFHQFNQIRTERGLPKLRPHKRCTQSAVSYARELYEDWNCPPEKTGHRSRRYGNFVQRVRHFGIPGAVAENLFCAPRYSTERILSGFMNSPGHRKNMLSTKYRSTGIGVINGRWVQCFTNDVD